MSFLTETLQSELATVRGDLSATRVRLAALESQLASHGAFDVRSAIESALLASFSPPPGGGGDGGAAFAVSSSDFAAERGFLHADVVGVLKSLEVDFMLQSAGTTVETWELTEEALGYLEKGSPEVQCFSALPDGGTSKEQLEGLVGKELVAIGLGKCLGKKWVKRDKDTGVYTREVANVDKDELVEQLRAAQSPAGAPPAVAKELKSRKLIVLKPKTTFRITRGDRWALARVKPHADLTKELLDSGAWAAPGAAFRAYNFETAGRDVGGGCVHALMRVRAEFRQILLEMGFSEMPTNRWVESSFWNFDALFQPQSHPARDAHDTFFLTDPAATRAIPEGLLSRVQAMHEGGGGGSLGYRYAWKRGEAEKNLLRTHTTAISARMLHALATAPGGFKPAKLFSIDRVFRNEALDATHLAEFHQVEGVVADVGLSLGDLIGVITEFFRRIGITELRFKPAYNPYTEPSMEVFGYHPDLKKWTEIGNSGIFRPEMLAPLGLPPNVRVIAWGLSLERPTMIKYRCKNIRELFGHKSQFEMSRGAPIARF